MREIVETTRYLRELEKVKRSGKCRWDEITVAIDLLRNDTPLPGRYRDHPLKSMKGLRECHVRGDLLLVYEKKPGELHLLRLASHSEIFGR